MFKKVLVPLDGTEMAEGILPYVTQVAKSLDTPLVLLSVIDPDALELPESLKNRPDAVHTYVEPGGLGGIASVTPVEPGGSTEGVHPHERGGTYVTQLFEAAELGMKRHLAEVARELEKKGVTVESHVVFGRPADEILRVVEGEGCDLIAMSTHGRSAMGRGVLGSVTDNVIHNANVPVLTITPERAQSYWKENSTITGILVPLDGSELAETVLPYVEALAKAMSLEVTLVRSLRFDGFYPVYADGYVFPGEINLESEVEAEAIDYLKAVSDRLAVKGMVVSWKLLRGEAARTIVDLAHESSQDLIALTTHGRSGLTRWVLGSVAEKLVRASGDPVLVIPPPANE